jgi:hypothetical protein
MMFTVRSAPIEYADELSVSNNVNSTLKIVVAYDKQHRGSVTALAPTGVWDLIQGKVQINSPRNLDDTDRVRILASKTFRTPNVPGDTDAGAERVVRMKKEWQVSWYIPMPNLPIDYKRGAVIPSTSDLENGALNIYTVVENPTANTTASGPTTNWTIINEAHRWTYVDPTF